VVVLVLVAACGSTGSGSADGPSTSPPSTLPTSTTEAPIAPATTDPPGTTRFNVYWLRDCPPADTATAVGDCRITVGESRTTTETDILTAALVALGDGPNEGEVAVGLTSNIRPIVDLAGVTVTDGVAVVDYNRYFETATTRPQVAQVVYTLTQFPTVTAVQFLVDGAANGATGTRPTGRDDVLELVPPVLVESPAMNAIVSPTFTVAGSLASADVTFTTRVFGPDPAFSLEVPGAAIPGAPTAPPPFLQRVDLPAGTTGLVTLVMTAADGTETAVPVIVQAP
jgi:hypothetical protein